MHPSESLDVNGATYGSRKTLASTIVIPTPTAPGVYSNSGVSPMSCAMGGALNVDSQSCTLSGGTYVFSSLRVNSGTLNVTGESVIYVNGDVEFNSAAMSVLNNLPANLTIRMTTPGQVKINSCPNIFADIIAPLADVEVNSHAGADCHFYGRLWGKTLKANSHVLMHVDESLPLYSNSSLPPNSSVSLSLVR